MKTMRYLLMAVALSAASLVFATAQSLAQQPEVQMHSTSGMVYSGSTLPSAAVDGAVLTGTTVGTYSPATTSGPNRGKKGWGESGGNDRPEPYADPIGDGMVVLLLFTCAYLVYRVYRRKRV